ncbi:hypothetical protein [Variovorax sp. CF313]|uniref:hypothetical protein n=1 Tax=Variovorax sp. CF313 TaxID=1144315 RepID=UPI0012FA2D05|nr:hypothetical protein [Variovorax sp. CF313]
MQKRRSTEPLSARLLAIGESVRSLIRGAEIGALSASKLQVLHQFTRHPPTAFPAQISAALMWEPSRALKDIKALVDSGHLLPATLTNDGASTAPIDKRHRRYSLTPAGLEQAERFAQVLAAIDESLMPIVSVRAEQGTRHLFQQLVRVGKVCNPESTRSIEEAIRTGRLSRVRRRP